MADYRLSEEQIASYRSDGYLMIPNYFPQADMELLLQIARADQALADNASDHPTPMATSVGSRCAPIYPRAPTAATCATEQSSSRWSSFWAARCTTTTTR